MSFRVEGTSVVRTVEDGPDVGVCLALTADMAQRIADSLNESSSAEDLRARKDPLTGEMVAGFDVNDRRPLSDVLGEGKHVKVIGPYATIEMGTPDGRQIRALAPGSVLPPDVPVGKARHLVDVGLAQVVEAGSPVDVYEGPPTERQRVEAASLDPAAPTVGRPAPGTAAADYDEDPVAAAQRAAEGMTSGPAQPAIAGSGQSVAGDATLAPVSSSERDPDAVEVGDKPHGNASEAKWRDYHVSRLVADGAAEDDARAEADGMSRDEIKARYA